MLTHIFWVKAIFTSPLLNSFELVDKIFDWKGAWNGGDTYDGCSLDLVLLCI